MKIFLFAILIFIFTAVKSQAPDFIIEDIYNIEHHLYDELNAGNTVIIDFFGVSCPTCRNDAPVLDSIWQANQANTLLWGIESTGYDSTEIEEFKTELGVNYTMCMLNDSVIDLYGINHTPVYFVVCPDKRYREISLSNIPSAIDNCNTNTYTITNNNKNTVDIFQTYSGINIKLKKQAKNIKILSILGKQIYHKENTNKAIFNNLNKGIYILHITYYDKSFVCKKIITK